MRRERVNDELADTITYKGRTVPLDRAEGVFRAAVGDALGLDAAREKKRAERLAAAVRYIERQGGPNLPPETVYAAPPESLFQDPDDPSGWRDFLPAPDLETIARYLIEDDEDALGHLARYRVVYLWKRRGGQSQGQPTLGKCSKASGPAKHFADSTWIIWLAADWARDYELTRVQVEAALHHELTHAGEKEIEVTRPDGETATKIVPAVRGHDCEMFSAEIERYGLWRQPLKAVAPAFRQLSLLDYVPRDGETEPEEGPDE